MKILCVGGGSGGHITPIVAVLDELRKTVKLPAGQELEARVWVDRKFAPQARKLLGSQTRVEIIASGKFRRYANLQWRYRYFSWYHLTRTHLPNIRDLFKIVGGLVQSCFKLIHWRPDAVFCKGGYVCLPVGLAAHLLKIPLVIHDSDTVPGLTNRVLAKYAKAIGTGAPVENYPNYPKSRTKFVGIPVRPEFHVMSAAEKKVTKKQLGFNPAKPLVFVTGGGLGAAGLNNAVTKNATDIVALGAQLLLLSGRGKQVDVPSNLKQDFVVKEFITDDFPLATMSADVAVVRSSATTVAELATVGAAVILVPAPYISGDHQAKNAAVYEKAKAAIVLSQFDLDKDPSILASAIQKILIDDTLRKQLSENLSKFAKPNAIHEMAEMILEVTR